MNFNEFLQKGGVCLVLASGTLYCSAPLFAADRYVVEPGTIAEGNGGVYTDWSIAATQIQWAVDAATNAGDTVWVSNGVYLLTNQIVVISNMTLRSANGPEVTIVNGGFAAEAPDATTNNRCLYMSNISAFVHGFTFSNGACTNIGGAGVWMGRGVLSNCTVCNNTLFQPTNTSGLYFGGGGIVTYGASTVTACRIINNTATNPAVILTGNSAAQGGGLYVRSGAGYVVNCLISNNVIYSGGVSDGGAKGAGAFFDGGAIQSSLICNNSNQVGRTGGIYLDTATMMACTVAVNWASDIGGCETLRGTITNCVISNNIGRGIRLAPNTVAAMPKLKNSTIVGNTREGVFMYSSLGTTIVSECIIAENLSNGVTMYNISTNKYLLDSVVRNNRRGGVKCEYHSVIRNCLIAANTNAGNWGGMVIEANASTSSISSCTIASNQSTGLGAGLRIESTNMGLLVSSCVICSNGLSGTNDVVDACAPTNYNRLQYSCLGSNPGFTGAGIIVADPKFKNLAGGNYRLNGNSPCVNTGSNETWMTNACDLDKNQRIRYGIVDMGAYERINEGTVYIVH